MIITKHTISGFAGFSSPIEFSLNKNTTLLLGINGAGKTSILNSIFASIGYCISDIEKNKIQELGISSKTISIGSEFLNVNSEFKLENNKLNLIDSYKIGYRLLQNGQTNIIGSHIDNIKHYISKKSSDYDNGILPVFRYFQSEKNIDSDKGIVNSQKFNNIDSRNIGYNNNASKGMLIEEVTSFLINQFNIENQYKIDNKDFGFETKVGAYLRETLNKFTTILYGKDIKIKVQGSKFSSGQSIVVTKEKEKEELEFSQLSSGEKYVISLVLEIIYRIVILNPRATDYNIVDGIILIDEIENHLHPKWQLTIIKALETCFPNIQFIVSSHSPLIASSVRKEQIIALSNFEIIPNEELPDVYTGTADELLDKILNSDIQISEYKDERNSIDILINLFEFNKAEKELTKLKEKIKSKPQWLADMENKISFGKA